MVGHPLDEGSHALHRHTGFSRSDGVGAGMDHRMADSESNASTASLGDIHSICSHRNEAAGVGEYQSCPCPKNLRRRIVAGGQTVGKLESEGAMNTVNDVTSMAQNQKRTRSQEAGVLPHLTDMR